MTRAGWFLWVAFAVTLAAAGCKEDLSSCPDCAITTIAMFDPSAGIVPLPNDIAKAATGKLPTTVEVTAADGTKKTLGTFPPPMKEFVENYLNLAPGFPVEMPLSIKFSCEHTAADAVDSPCRNTIDTASLAGDSIRLYDVTAIRAAMALADPAQRAAALAAAGAPQRVQGLMVGAPVETLTYSEDKTLVAQTKYWESSAKAALPWQPGHTYYAVVTTGVKRAPREGEQEPVPIAASQVFSYLKSKTPLATCELGTDGAIVVDDKGHPKCVANVFVSDNQVEAVELALQLEAVRQAMVPFLDLFEASTTDPIARKDVAVAWVFTTWPAQVMLDADNGVIPLPNNLVRTSPNGPIAIPTTKTLANGTTIDVFPPAQKAFIENYMNRLDGFPQQQPVSLPFDTAAVDLASLAGSAVRMFDVTALLAEMAQPAADITQVPVNEVTGLVYGSDLLEYSTIAGLPVAQASVHGPSPWTPGHTYLGVATSMLKGAAGGAVLPPFVFGFVKVTQKLLTDEGDSLIPASKADATQLEALRSGMAPLLSWLEALPDGKAIPRADVSLAWTFTVSAANEAMFDPTTGTIPFPNELLIDPQTGKVALPIAASDPASVKALKAGMNTLDGFSNNGPATQGFSLPLDPATVTLIPTLAGLFPDEETGVPPFGIGVADITTVDPSDPSTLPNMDVWGPDRMTATYAGGQLILQNVSGIPLPPNHRFAVLLFSTLATQDSALPIHVSPVFWMARNELPLVVEGKSQMPSTLSDADAAQLEMLRQAYKPIFDALQGTEEDPSLLGIDRDKVLGFFTFVTGTTTADLQAVAGLLAKPTQGAGSLVDVATAGTPWDVAPHDTIAEVCKDCTFNTQMLLATPDLTDPAHPVLGHFQANEAGQPVLTARALKFLFALPTGTGPFGIAIYQHGIAASRNEAALLANDLAKAGFATFAIDAPMHGEHPIRIPGTDSGTGFFSADVFAVRDNMRQAALDQAQAIRFVREVLSTQFPDLATSLDPTKVVFVGTSLGAMTGTLTAGLVQDLPKVAMIAPGAHLIRVFTETQRQSFKQPLLDALAALGITEGSAAYMQFLMLAQWAMDRADPVNWAAVAKGAKPGDRFRIVESQGDGFIPNGTTEALGKALGIPKGSDAFKAFAAGTGATDTICHSFFMYGCDPDDYPSLDQAKVAAAQAEARAFVIDFLKD